MARAAATPIPMLLSLLGAGCASPPPPAVPVVSLETAAVGAVEIYGPGLLTTDSAGETVTFALTASASVVIVRVWPGWRLEQLYPSAANDSTYFQTGFHTVHVSAPVPWSPVGRNAGLVPGLTTAQDVLVEQCVWREVRRRQPPPTRREMVRDTSRRAQSPPAPSATEINYQEIEGRCRSGVAQAAERARPPRRETALVPAPEHYLVLVTSDVTQDARRLRMRLGGVNISQSSLASVLQVLPRFLAGADATTWAGYVARVPVR
jgi:hypothetical protein